MVGQQQLYVSSKGIAFDMHPPPPEPHFLSVYFECLISRCILLCCSLHIMPQKSCRQPPPG